MLWDIVLQGAALCWDTQGTASQKKGTTSALYMQFVHLSLFILPSALVTSQLQTAQD